MEKIPVYSFQGFRVTAIFHKLPKISRFSHLQNQYSPVQLRLRGLHKSDAQTLAHLQAIHEDVLSLAERCER